MVVGIVGIAVGTAAGRRLSTVVALAAVFTVLGLEIVPPPGTPTEMWASHAAAFMWTAMVWDGRSRPTSTLAGHLAAQLAMFWLVGAFFGWPLLDLAWMGVVNIGVGVAMFAAYARLHRGPDLAPLSGSANLGLLAVAIVGSMVIAALGGFPYLDLGQLDRLTLWWTLRGTVYGYVSSVTLLLLFFGKRPTPTPTPWWAAPVLVPLGVACVWITYLDPELPLTWFLLLPALVAGSLLTPRGAACYALFVAMLGALATLLPINQFGYQGFLPGSVIIDLLLTVCTFVTIHLAILRMQRVTAAGDLLAQRRSAEEQAALLGTVFETMRDGLVVLDAGRRVVLHNDAARRLVGKRVPVGEETVDWVSYLGLRRLDGQPLEGDELVGGASEDYLRQLVISNEGAERVVELGAWPLPGGEDRMLILFSDVTAERERLSELTGFAGVVAHDLRGPLSSLHGWLELAEDSLESGLSDKAGEFVSRAQLSSVRMRQVIEDWLAYTVQRDGVLSLTTVPLELMLEEIVTPFGTAEETVAPVFDVTARDVVKADRVLTKQLLANLIGNSVKYTPEGERPHIAIRSAPDTEEGFVRIEVSDRGIGLPPGEEEKIFEEFHRAAAHAQEFSGTGLGLSLCRRIVHRHGGSIHARGNAEGGATFSFTLPAG